MTNRILLADDSVTIRKVVELTFSDEDFTIDSVGDGAQAIEHARAQRPDIIISDVIMPGLNGYELCQQVKADPNLRSVPFLFLKGTFESFDEEKARACGADGYVVKPFESQELIAKVRQLIEGAALAPVIAPVQPPQRAAEPPALTAIIAGAPVSAAPRPAAPAAAVRSAAASEAPPTPPAPAAPVRPVPPSASPSSGFVPPRPMVQPREAVATPRLPPRPAPPPTPALRSSPAAPPPVPAMQTRPATAPSGPPAMAARPAPPIPPRPTRPVPVAPAVAQPALRPTPPIHPPPQRPSPPPPPPPPATVKAPSEDFGFDFGEADGDRFTAPSPQPAVRAAAPPVEPSAESDEDLWSEVSLRGTTSDLLDVHKPAGPGAVTGVDITEPEQETAGVAPDVLFDDEAVFEEVSTARLMPLTPPEPEFDVAPPPDDIVPPVAPDQPSPQIAPVPAAITAPAAPVAVDPGQIERLVASLVEAAVRKVLEPIVNDAARATIESVAWEVIPDLAEAMIRAEIERVRQQSARAD